MLKRLLSYTKRHGFRAMLSRTVVFVKRREMGGRMALFFCDLEAGKFRESELGAAVVERKDTASQLKADELSEVAKTWNGEAQEGLFHERFKRGASLWLLKLDGKVAAFGWTMVGTTMEPHYFPVWADDVHLFDFFVFPEYRGRRLNPALVNHILALLAGEHHGRALIEAAEWNVAQLASLGRTPFQLLGHARKIRCLGKELVFSDRKTRERVSAMLLKHPAVKSDSF